jgi:hypothetical protein
MVTTMFPLRPSMLLETGSRKTCPVETSVI